MWKILPYGPKLLFSGQQELAARSAPASWIAPYRKNLRNWQDLAEVRLEIITFGIFSLGADEVTSCRGWWRAILASGPASALKAKRLVVCSFSRITCRLWHSARASRERNSRIGLGSASIGWKINQSRSAEPRSAGGPRPDCGYVALAVFPGKVQETWLVPIPALPSIRNSDPETATM